MGCRPMPKNHRLQQRVRGQPIRPMHACTGHLTGSVKTPNGRGTVKIGDNSTALVVLSRRYGNEIAGDVNAHLQTARIDGWEVALKLLLRNMPGIEIDTVYFTPLHLTDNSPRDHIARRQLFQRVIALHKRLSILMAKLSSLPTQRFGNEKGTCLRVVQCGRMELDELHIGYRGPNAPCHRHSIARGDLRIGGVFVNSSASTGCQKSGPSAESNIIPSPFIQSQDASTNSMPSKPAHQQLTGKVVFEYLHRGLLAHGLQQRPFALPSCVVGRMHNAIPRVTALPPQRQYLLAIRAYLRIETGA